MIFYSPELNQFALGFYQIDHDGMTTWWHLNFSSAGLPLNTDSMEMFDWVFVGVL